MTQKYRSCCQWILAVLVVVQCVMIAGCHRSFYRRQADAEANRLVLEKAIDARWASADGRVDIDPQSRMFNPFSEDHAPLPPDDPTSHQLMHRVDGRSGFPHWHANGDTDVVENPRWLAYLPVDRRGRSILSLERACELALLHSPQFQQQRETLYLSALDVSLQRFGFDTQLFAGFNKFISTSGRFRNPGGRSATNLSGALGVNSGGIDFQRLGITGATFTAGLANTLMWNLAGNNTQSASGLFDFSIIQPLLRGAGRERIMESLTQSERTLLANIRQFERFRRGFYLQIATGRNPGAGPNRLGNFPALAAGASLQAGGYFGLLQQQQQIRNLEFNLRLLEGVLEQFRTFYDEDRIDRLQVRQFEATVFQQQQNLLNAKVNFQTDLDQFKQSLGLPPYLNVVIEDPLLDRFKIIGDSISVRLSDISKLRIEVGEIIDELVELDKKWDARLAAGEDDDTTGDDATANDAVSDEQFNSRFKKLIVDRALELEPLIRQSVAMAKMVQQEDVSAVKGDIEKLDTLRPARLAYLKKLRRDIASGKLPSEVEPEVFSAESIPQAQTLARYLDNPDDKRSVGRRLSRITTGLDQLQRQLESLEEESADLDSTEVANLVKSTFRRRTPDLLTELDGTILELALIQSEARSNAIEIETVEIDSDHAFEIARCFRRDWMNARAGLVDRWRQIEFVADQLESQVDLVFEGDIGTASDNPFSFRYETGQLRAGLRFDAPIVRQFERNEYREALITYQQERRAFYQFEDDVSRNLRLIIRNIDRNKVLFELNRQSIQVNIDAVELSRFRLEAPPRFGAQNSFGQTTARDLSQAINGLNAVQNQYVQSWVQYEVLRRSLDFDMGTMQLDPAGQWIDPGSFDSSVGIRAAVVFGIDDECDFCDRIYPAEDAPQASRGVSVLDEATASSTETETAIEPAGPSEQEAQKRDEPRSGLLQPLLEPPRAETATPLDFE